MVKFIFLSMLCSLLLTAKLQADENLRDPTRPLDHRTSTSHGEASLQLQSVLYSEARKLAYINGQPVMEQETLPGTRVKVLRIQPESVLVQQDGKTWRLTLNSLDVRQPSRNP